MKKILVIIGTRPEAIKMSPLILSLKKDFNVELCVTAQHREMLDQALSLFNIKPDYDLDIMKDGQDLFYITHIILKELQLIIEDSNPDLILVHGDTTTTMVSSLAAFYKRIPLGHIEAGLRTHDMLAPYPEEMNRRVASLLANFHFAPTQLSKKNLINEDISEKNIYVTGNTVIDSLLFNLEKARQLEFSPNTFSFDIHNSQRIILVTGHRRENFGKGFEEICIALKEIADANKDLDIIYPVHLNPNVQNPVNKILSSVPNIHLIAPMEYLPFIKLMDLSYLILTDSGGIQEEAPTLGKPVLVMRNSTERPEAVKAGTVKLVGSDASQIVKNVNSLLNDKNLYEQMSSSHNPYGDGKSSERIKSVLKEIL